MEKILSRLNKFNAPIFAIAISFILACAKAIVGYLSGSLAIVTAAIDSITDIATSLLNFIFIKKADEPPDSYHQFGHGKLEAYATLIQSIIIFLIGAYIFYKAIVRIKFPEYADINFISIGVMIFSIFAGFVISRVLKIISFREKSKALEADSMHYSIDVITNSSVLISILIIKVTNIVIVDSIIAILMSLYIIYSAIKLHVSSLTILLDATIPADDLQTIKNILKKYSDETDDKITCTLLRTRSDGNTYFVNIILQTCGELTLSEVHLMCDMMEAEIRKVYSDMDITIHGEPLPSNCGENSELLKLRSAINQR